MNKIKKTREFEYIYNNSKKIHTKYFIIFKSKNNKNEKNFGFVSSKKTGNAVQRNRIKRITKETVRLNEKRFETNYNYIFVAKSILKNNKNIINYAELSKDIVRILK